jgi:hypothetical protein
LGNKAFRFGLLDMVVLTRDVRASNCTAAQGAVGTISRVLSPSGPYVVQFDPPLACDAVVGWADIRPATRAEIVARSR